MPTPPPLPDPADVAAARAVLADPDLPGRPFTEAEIDRVLPLLAEGPGDLVTEAWGTRLLAAVAEEDGAGEG